MMTTQVLPNLHLITTSGGWQIYVWQEPDGVALIDSGAAGTAGELTQGLAQLGVTAADVKKVILTHFHDDHAGGAAELATWGDIEILAHARDAPIIRGDVPGPLPNLSEGERSLHASLSQSLPAAPPCRVDRELKDHELLDFAGGALVIPTPGHTRGSIALWLQRHRVLFTGDTVAESQGRIVVGPFNLDPAENLASFRELCQLDVDVACFGHGRPLTRCASAALKTAASNPIML